MAERGAHNWHMEKMRNNPAADAEKCGKTNLLEFTLPELEAWMGDNLGAPAFRARQLWQWLWRRMATDFDAMTDIAARTRLLLGQKARISWPGVADIRKSADGCVKFLLCLEDGEHVETVLIPSENRDGKIRYSQCLSTQVGCPMGCTFCATGQMGFVRNMSMGEIMGQVLVARNYLGDSRPDRPVLRNLVFMGMGEPLLNLKNLLNSLESLNSGLGMNFSPRRITVSTCGIRSGLEALGKSGLAYLAVSLHAPTQELRARIMPGAARWPLDEMLAALKAYPLKQRERITFEYLLLGGVNDGIDDARALARLVGEVRGKLNLIVYNPVPGSAYRAPSDAAVLAFEQLLWQKNITAIVRKSKGRDISAACGQLWAQHAARAEARPGSPLQALPANQSASQ